MANFAAPTLSVGGKALGSHATASAGKGGAWQLVQGVDCVAADETGSGDGGSNREDGSHPEMPPSK